MGFPPFLRLGKLLHRTNDSSPSKSLPLALFPTTEYNVSAGLWANSIQALPDSKECRVRKIVHCKAMSGSPHEFLLVYIQHPSGKEAIMLVDREPVSDTSSAFSDDTIYPNKPVERNASHSPTSRDRVKLSYDGTDRCITRHIPSWAQIHAIKYRKLSKAPSVGHFAALLIALNRHQLSPALSGELRSAWFVYCAVEALQDIFGGDVQKSKRWGREPYGGMKVDGRDSVKTIVREFTPIWEDFSRRRTQRGAEQSVGAMQPRAIRQEEKKTKKKEQMDSFAEMLRTMEV